MTIDQANFRNHIAKNQLILANDGKDGNSKQVVEYNTDFFVEERENSLKSAKVIVPLVLSIVNARSVVDVGCGVGAFLHEFRNLGIGEIMGIDGTIPGQDLLLIPEAQMLNRDLSKPLKLDKKFDLVVSLEVAEHLDPEFADVFISNLTEAGDVILFSAAIPGQGGTHHMNEQWPSYWAEKFERHGFQAIDCIRPLIWDNEGVDLIYAQNTVLYARKDVIQEGLLIRTENNLSRNYPLSLIHPRFYAGKTANSLKIYNALLRRMIQFSQELFRKVRA